MWRENKECKLHADDKAIFLKDSKDSQKTYRIINKFSKKKEKNHINQSVL